MAREQNNKNTDDLPQYSKMLNLPLTNQTKSSRVDDFSNASQEYPSSSVNFNLSTHRTEIEPKSPLKSRYYDTKTQEDEVHIVDQETVYSDRTLT